MGTGRIWGGVKPWKLVPMYMPIKAPRVAKAFQLLILHSINIGYLAHQRSLKHQAFRENLQQNPVRFLLRSSSVGREEGYLESSEFDTLGTGYNTWIRIKFNIWDFVLGLNCLNTHGNKKKNISKWILSFIGLCNVCKHFPFEKFNLRKVIA